MRRIVFGLWCALLWVRPFISGELNPQLSALIQWGLLGTGLLLCWQRPSRSSPHASALLWWALTAWLGAGLLALLLTPQFAGMRTTWLILMANAIIIPVVWYADAATRRSLLVGLACGGLLISAFAFLQFFAIFPSLAGISHDTLIDRAIQDVAVRRRVLGTFVLPNFFAGYLIILAPLIASALAEASGARWRKIFLAVSLLAIGLATILTQSLGALFALFVACGIVMAQRQTQRALWWTWLFVGLALIVGLWITRPMLRQFGHSHNPVRNRLTYWHVTADVIREHPIRGVGLGQFRNWYDAKRPAGSPRVVHAHNSYLEIWAEMGLFGLLAWLWVVWEVVRMAARSSPWLAVAAWAFVLHNLVDAPLYIAQVNVLWWVLIGLIAANEKIWDAS